MQKTSLKSMLVIGINFVIFILRSHKASIVKGIQFPNSFFSVIEAPKKLKTDLYFCSLFFSSFTFPSLQTLGEDLVTVLDYLHVKYVIGLGEGAG